MLKVVLIIAALLLLITLILFFIYRFYHAPVSIKDKSGRILLSAPADRVDEAAVQWFNRLYAEVRNAVRKSKVERHVHEMELALKRLSRRLSPDALSRCSRILEKSKSRLTMLRNKEAGTLSEAQRSQLTKDQERRRLAQERKQKKREAELSKKEKEIALAEHRLFVAEQRKLMKDSLRYDVLRRDGFRCQLCGATAQDHVRLHVDHVIPVSKGGKTELSNLRTLCERCNMGKSDKLETPEAAFSDETVQCTDTE